MIENKLKICFLIPGFADGGAEKQCIYLINELQKRPDVDLTLICFFEGVNFDLLERTNLNFHNLNLKSNYDLRGAYTAARIVRRARSQVIFTWLTTGDIFGALIKFLVPNLKWVIAERNSAYPPLAKVWLRERVAWFSDALISNSEAGDKFWRARNYKKRRFVVGNIANFIGRSVGRVKEYDFVFIGRMEDQKNVILITKIFCQLVKRYDDVSCCLVGEGSLRSEVQQLVEAMGATQRVWILKFRKDILKIYRAAGTIVSLSKYEGMPNVLMEAASLNIPIIASRIPEHKALLGSSYPFLLDETNDLEECLTQFANYLDCKNPEQYLEYAQQRLLDMSARQIADKYFECFLQVIESELSHRTLANGD